MRTLESRQETTEKRNFVLSVELARKADDAAREKHWNFSQLVRFAIERIVEQIEREKKEKALMEACESYHDFNKKFSSEWAQFETRVE